MELKKLGEVHTKKFRWNLWLILARLLGNSVKILNEFYENRGELLGSNCLENLRIFE